MVLNTFLTIADMVLSLNTNIQTRCKILQHLSYPKNEKCILSTWHKYSILCLLAIFTGFFGKKYDL